jgi:hypothetical protein
MYRESFEGGLTPKLWSDPTVIGALQTVLLRDAPLRDAPQIDFFTRGNHSPQIDL